MICPNLSDPIIRKQFNNLVDVVGEDFAYYLWNKNDGLPLSQTKATKRGKEVIEDSKLYTQLEEHFSGDSIKATMGMAITFGSNFQKANPGFAKMTPKKQIKLINKYILSKDLPVEQVAKNYIKKTKGKIKIDKDLTEVSREDLRKDPNSIVSKVDKVDAFDRVEAYRRFKENPISRHINFVNMHRIVNDGAYATWSKTALTLYQGSDFTDLYHESWHEFSQKYLTPIERNALYNIIRDREGNVTLGDKSIPYYQLTQRQAEEILAEEYRAYAIQKARNEDFEPEAEGMIKKLFNRIFNFLKSFFTGVSKTGPVSNQQLAESQVTKVFEDLFQGKIYTYTPSDANITENLLKRTKAFQLDTKENSLEYQAHAAAELLDFTDYVLYDRMKKDGVKISALLSEDFRKQYVPVLYNQAKQAFEDVIQDLKNQLDVAINDNNELNIEFIEERLAYLEPIVESDDTWNQFVEQHQSFVKGDIFKVGADFATKEDTQDQIKEEESEEDSAKDISQYDDRAAINPMQYYDPYVMELIRSLPNKRIVNNQVQIEKGTLLGLPKAGNFLQNKNLLQDKLAGAQSYEEVLSIIEGLIEFNPQMEDLLAMLPNPTGVLSPEELLLKSQFVQSLTMPQVQPLSVKAEAITKILEIDGQLTPSEGLNFHTFYISTLTKDALLEFFDNEFQVNALRNHRAEVTDEERRKFVVLAPDSLEFATFSMASAISEYKLSPQSKTKEFFDFMSDAFGIDLYPKNKTSFFAKDGSPNYSVFPYTQGQETAIRTSALAAYNKMVLFDLIGRLNTKKYKSITNLVNQKVETPARTFISDLNKSLVTQLEEAIKSLQGDLTITEKDTEDVVALKKVLQQYKAMGNPTLRNEHQLLFKAAENFYKVTKSASFLNDEGNMEWSIREWQHLVSQVTKLNTITTVNDLSGHLTLGKNDFVGSFNADQEFETNSALLSKLFNSEGIRRKSRSKDFILELVNFTGYQVGAEGRKTINLNVEDKLVQDLGGYLKDGIIPNLTPGAKASYYAIRLTGSREERLYFKFDTSEGSVPFVTSEVATQFYKYLKFELSRAYTDANNKTKLNPKEKRGSSFIIFNTILPKTEKEKLLKVVTTSEKNKEEAVKEALSLINIPTLGGYLNKFFEKELEEYKVRLAEAINQGKQDGLELAFNRVFPTTKNLDATLFEYLINDYTHQVEYMHLFVGDPSNFNIKSKDLEANNWREVFKRLGASISPGRQPRIDDQDLLTFNTTLPRELEKIVSPSTVRDYSKNFNYIQYQDVATFTEEQGRLYRQNIISSYAEYLAGEDKNKLPKEEYLVKAEEILGPSLTSVERQDKEADAQAYMNLDFLRFYLNSVGEWGPKQEKAYKNEVLILQKMMEYRASQDPAIYNEIKQLAAKTDLGILTSLKLGYYGSPVENLNYVTLGKYSVFPLLPSAVFESDLEPVMLDMFTKGVDFATFDSGSKMAVPVDSIPFYRDEVIRDFYGKERTVKVPNEISKENIASFPIEGLRRQQYIAPKFKNEVTLGTQLVKLIFSNFYVNGELSPAIKSNPRLAEKIQKAQDTFIRSIETIVEAEKAKIYTQIGAEVVDGKIKSFDAEMFSEWIKAEFDRKDLPQSVYEYLVVENGRFYLPLDLSPQRVLFESVLASALSKRVVKPKMFGEAYIQLASTGFNRANTRYTNPTAEEVAKYGVSGLRDYGRVVNGKHQPADIKLSFNPTKHAPLLNLTHNGQVIGTLENLNKALLDDNWVEQHSAKLTIVGVRIPTQGFNSMEYLRVRQFLPTTAGPIIIVPPSIVTKSGSDFDIDKLFMYEPELAEDGSLIPTDKRVYNKPQEIYNFVKYRNQHKQDLIEAKRVLKNKRDEFIERFKDNQPLVDVFDSFVANNNMIITVSPKKKKTAKQEAELIDDTVTQAFVLEDAINASQQDPEIIQLTKTFSKIRRIYQEYRDLSPGKIKSGASNELISVMSEVLSEPAILPQLIKPNATPILKTLADSYDDKYRKGKGKINSSRIFSRNVNLQIFEEIASAKKALGIDAKANALHKLYQQTGLKYTDQLFLQGYKLRSNRSDEGILLGSIYEANNPYRDSENLYMISDVIDEFINGHVDAEKEDWINYFNADTTRTGIIQQMLLNGTPIEDALLLVNQPIIHNYIKGKRLNNTMKTLNVKPKYAGSMILEGLKAAGLSKYIVTVNKRFNLPLTILNMLSDDLFSKHLYNFNEEKYTPTTDTSRTSYADILSSQDRDLIVPQLAFLTQYILLEQQNNNLLKLTSVIDFNTSAYRNLNSFHKVADAVEEAKDFVNDEALQKIINKSVISAFNITDDAMTIGNQMFDIMGTPQYQQFVNEFVRIRGRYWDTDTTISQVNNLNNTIVHYLIQKYSSINGENYYEKYGPNSHYLTQGAVGNLAATYSKLFKSYAKQDKNLATFARTNLFLKNFRKKNIENTNKFYIAMETNERDPITVDAIQSAFMDGLNYDYSKPIVINGKPVDLSAEVRKFFEDVANATLVGQGYSIKFRSIQPYLPIASLTTTLGAMDEIRRLRDEVFSSDEGLTEEEIAEKQKSRVAFLNNLILVEKINAMREFSKKGKTLNKLKYFPDYIKETQAKGIRISLSSKGIGNMLMPNTSESKSKSKFEIEYNGNKYKDALAAYEANKFGYQTESKRGDNSLLVDLMTDILATRFRQYPRMFGLVYDLGGVNVLGRSIFQGVKELGPSWAITETYHGNYIQSLINAYNQVEPELVTAWLESKQKSKKTEQNEEVEEFEDGFDEDVFDDPNYLKMLSEQSEEEDQRLTLNNQPTVDLEDLGIGLKKKSTENKPPISTKKPVVSTPKVEISSNSKGLLAALTNPTELAKSKGNLSKSYPVRLGNTTFPDAEAAYQSLKKYATKDDGPNSTFNLMVSIIKAKLDQHPSLIQNIKDEGGSAWILKATHQPTSKNTVWETGGKNWFIKALNTAFQLASMPGFDIGLDISLKYSEITVERFAEIIPGKTQQQYEHVVEQSKKQVRDKNPDYNFDELDENLKTLTFDFTSLC